MSVLRLTRDEASSPAVSGGAMDRAIERRGLDRRLLWGGGALAVLLLLALGWWFGPRAGDQSVAAERLTISEVRDGVFDDFLPLRARATPLVTVYLDAVEGGRVEKVLVEDGATVTQGQLLAVLSNSDLQLNLLARQADVSREINSMRSQELALAQTRLGNERTVLEADLATRKARRQYELQKPLAERGFVTARAFRDSQDDYLSNRDRLNAVRRSQATDEKLQSSQLAQLRASANSLNAGLKIARQTVESLNIRAPVAGQLTAFSIELGQSTQRGERLGQIDSPGRTKLVADVDEFYLGKVVIGQRANLDQAGKSYALKVQKIYPQVKNGQFQVDLVFTGKESSVQRGQTLQAKLVLSDPAPARLIPSGSWYTDTGGAWVFVVAPDGSSAERREVRLGRRNTDHVEVLDGLQKGERVITSPYTGLVDKTRLSIDAK